FISLQFFHRRHFSALPSAQRNRPGMTPGSGRASLPAKFVGSLFMSIRLTRRAALISSAGAAALPATGWAQTTDQAALADQVDAFVKRAMAAFPDQPAVSIAVVKDGRPVLTRGYGVRAIGGAAV